MSSVEMKHVVGGPALVLDNEWQAVQVLAEVDGKPYAATGVGETKGAAVWDAIRDLSKQAGTDYQAEIAGALIDSVISAVLDVGIDLRGLMDDIDFDD